jgi:hypothetical protein
MMNIISKAKPDKRICLRTGAVLLILISSFSNRFATELAGKSSVFSLISFFTISKTYGSILVRTDLYLIILKIYEIFK